MSVGPDRYGEKGSSGRASHPHGPLKKKREKKKKKGSQRIAVRHTVSLFQVHTTALYSHLSAHSHSPALSHPLATQVCYIVPAPRCRKMERLGGWT